MWMCYTIPVQRVLPISMTLCKTSPPDLHGVLTFCLNLLQIPIVRGVPRKDAKEFGGLSAFTSNAELINVRLHCCAY